MNRRHVIKSLSLAGLALTIRPKIVFSQTEKQVRGLTISQIMAVAFPAVINEGLGGGKFYSTDLQVLYEKGYLKVGPLGPGDDVQQIVITCTWSEDDERANKTEKDKISLCANLIRNGLQSHDDMLYEVIDGKQVVVSETYRYEMSPIRTTRAYSPIEPHNVAYYFTISTTYVVID